MAWTEITRAQYRRDDLEYASDLRDARVGANCVADARDVPGKSDRVISYRGLGEGLMGKAASFWWNGMPLFAVA